VTKEMQLINTFGTENKHEYYPKSSTILVWRDAIIFNPYKATEEEYERPEGVQWTFLVPTGKDEQQFGDELKLVANNMIKGSKQNYAFTEEAQELNDCVMSTAASRK
jgi:hypothetical protein